LIDGENMRPSLALHANRATVREIALRHSVSNIWVLGSLLHGNNTEECDLDLLVDPTSETTLMDIGAIRYELRKLLDIEVDVLTPKALLERFRMQILSHAIPI
jgi:predicted nucleotidyltransferase